MLGVKIVCLGKLKEEYWRAAVREYEKRLSALCRFELVELPEARLGSSPNKGEISAALEREAGAVIPKLEGMVVPLCIEGRKLDSVGLSRLLSGAMQSPGAISFVIGSSYGLSDSVKALGTGISMSPMTFPHQLARVMLCEQIYRGLQILRGAPYHK
ncbi:23S rRNA (pseudouridine(1915)-N(3))-methyltransferase RlmH [Acutalibacter sp. 1XD8-36]|uniref:23S rRNA (pseudouridine(1915)-N(3))-methyltransferase RlmH n=1 Tax=Acutalibacter sp. 1XD8-36 TaxID=2320852 RepID=UPI001412290E|nr:23S rRNA (pseudouridine(1915)-N(3))-methyltransferase RlmH [Acutalibacter sp. 1XD8-36]NBJ89273.1 23S rRNA (pseudouridine(1915)-N(3))-methyltransferase RlmH [Acutalibacter sp. 1XD8-36]